MTEKCKHKWIDVKDGTFDQICIYCSIKQKQNVMSLPLQNAKEGMELGTLVAEGIARGINTLSKGGVIR